MKQKLVKGVRKTLPPATVRRLEGVYRRGRVQLLRMRYGNPAANARIIAIAGHSGKTTTAQLIMGLLVEAGHSVAVFDPSAHGNSVPALWRGLNAARHEKAEFVIIEVSPELVQSEALQALTIDTVVVTNACHEAEMLLAHQIEYAVIPDDHKFGSLAIAEHQIVSFGKSDDADAKIEKVKLYRKGTEIQFILDHHTPVSVATHLVGHANVINVAAAISAAYVLGVSMSTVEEGIARLEKLPGNFQYIDTTGSFMTVLDDAKSEASIELVIQSAKELAKRRLIVALVAEELSPAFVARMQHLPERLIAVGGKKLPSSIEQVSDIVEARALAERAAKKDDIVLLVGAAFNQDRL